MGTGRERDALPLLEQVLKQDPRHREDWLRLAALQLKFGDKTRAAAVLELASRLGFLTTAPERLQQVTLTAQIGAPFEAGSLMQSLIDSKQSADANANRTSLAPLLLAASVSDRTSHCMGQDRAV